jgi:hypothetical protein
MFPSLNTEPHFSICVVTLQKSLSSLELPGVATVANAMSRQNSLSFTGSVDETRHGADERHGEASSISQYGSKQRHKSNDPGRDLSIQVLEKFSLVTKFARDTTSSLFRDNSGAHGYGRQQHEYVFDNKASDKHKNQYITPEKAYIPSATQEVIYLAFNLVFCHQNYDFWKKLFTAQKINTKSLNLVFYPKFGLITLPIRIKDSG